MILSGATSTKVCAGNKDARAAQVYNLLCCPLEPESLKKTSLKVK